MNKTVIDLPSPKEILLYLNGDLSSKEYYRVYRFHFFDVYIWIDVLRNGSFAVKCRGKYFNDWIASFKVLFDSPDFCSTYHEFIRICKLVMESHYAVHS